MPGDGKTEKATPKKKRDERKKGNVFQSKEVVNAVAILGGFWILKGMGPGILEKLRAAMVNYFTVVSLTPEITIPQASRMISDGLTTLFQLIVPFLAVMMLIGYLSYAVQTRFIFQMDLVGFKFSRINPISGIKKMFSMRSVVELLKAVFKFLCIGLIVYGDIQKKIAEAMTLTDMNPAASLFWACGAVFAIVMKAGMVMIAIAALDFFYQWWEHERNMMMSKQDIKDEYKQLEGDPLIKGKIKERQRKMAAQRMMQQVPHADVVIANPTHFALALKYDPQQSKAPVVVAKGVDFLALKIIEVARAKGVQVTENPPLARALYPMAELDQEIPGEFYKAVAEILAYVYRQRQKGDGR